MRGKITLRFVLFLFLFLNINSYGQTIDNNERQYFEWFDNITDSKNSDLSNGKSYIEHFKTKKGYHKYYLSSSFLKGNVTYSNQKYHNIRLQYDLYNDQLILRLYNGENLKSIELIKDKVQEFSIDNKKFVKAPGIDPNTNIFLQVFLKNDKLGLYKKYYKKRNKHLDKDVVYYSFKEKSYYLIFYKDNYHKITSKKSIIRLFPEKKKQINSLYSNKDYLLRNNRDEFMKLLFQQISN